jgi:hypothetical protein
MGYFGKALILASIALSAWLLTGFINRATGGWIARRHKFIQFLIYLVLVLIVMSLASLIR